MDFLLLRCFGAACVRACVHQPAATVPATVLYHTVTHRKRQTESRLFRLVSSRLGARAAETAFYLLHTAALRPTL